MEMRLVCTQTVVFFLYMVFPILAYSDYDYDIQPTHKARSRHRTGNAEESQTTRKPENLSNSNIDVMSAKSTKSMRLSGNTRQGSEEKIFYPSERAGQKETCLYGFCYGVEAYPKDQIRRILNNSSFASGFFDDPNFVPAVIHINNRFNGGEESTLCESTVHTIFPEKATNLKKEEKFIVNHGQHKQHVVVETCVGKNGKCKFSDKFPADYTSHCVQKFMQVKLVAVEKDKLEPDTFEVPSCCVCTVKKTG